MAISTEGSVARPYRENPPTHFTEVHWAGDVGVHITLPADVPRDPVLDLFSLDLPYTWVYPPAILGPRGSLVVWANVSKSEAEPDFFGGALMQWLYSGVFFGLAARFGSPVFFYPEWGLTTLSEWYGGDDSSLRFAFGNLTEDSVIANLLPFGVWHCAMISWTFGGPVTIAYNDMPQTARHDGDTFDQITDTTDWPLRFHMFNASFYDFWWSTEFIDFNKVENRRRFINEDKTAVKLSPDGASGSPTARQPEFFFHPSKGEPRKYFTNRGSGGPVIGGYLVFAETAKPTMAGALS